MGLLSYIKGRRRGAEAHRLEREAMQDAFLSDALDGYDGTDGADALRRLSLLRQEVSRRTARRNRLPLYAAAVAAVSLLFLSVSIYLFTRYDLPEQRMAVLEHPVVRPDYPAADDSGSEPEEEAEVSSYSPVPEDSRPVKTPAPADKRPVRSAEETIGADVADALPVADLADAVVAVEEQAVAAAGKEKTMPLAASRPELAEQPAVVSDEAVVGMVTVQSRRKMSESASAASVLTAAFPVPAGGYEACYDYIRRHIDLVSDTAGRDTARAVVLRFVVDRKGRPGNFTVVKSFSPEAAQEVIRLLQAGPDWKPSGPVPAFTVTF